jgi:hypothetical protein
MEKKKGGQTAFFPCSMRCYFFMAFVADSSILRVGFVDSGK